LKTEYDAVIVGAGNVVRCVSCCHMWSGLNNWKKQMLVISNHKEIQKFRNHWLKLQLKQDSPKYMRNPQEKKTSWIWYLHHPQR